jgi:hypothetical protein
VNPQKGSERVRLIGVLSPLTETDRESVPAARRLSSDAEACKCGGKTIDLPAARRLPRIRRQLRD